MKERRWQGLVTELVLSTYVGEHRAVGERVLADRGEEGSSFGYLCHVLARCGGDTPQGVTAAWEHLVENGRAFQVCCAAEGEDPAADLARKVCWVVEASCSDVELCGASVDEVWRENDRLMSALVHAGGAGWHKCWSAGCVEARVALIGQILVVLDALVGHAEASADERRLAERRRCTWRAQHALATGGLLPWCGQGESSSGTGAEGGVVLYRVAPKQPGRYEAHGRYAGVDTAMAESGLPATVDWVTATGVRDCVFAHAVDDASADEVLWAIHGRGVTDEYCRLVRAHAAANGAVTPIE